MRYCFFEIRHCNDAENAMNTAMPQIRTLEVFISIEAFTCKYFAQDRHRLIS